MPSRLGLYSLCTFFYIVVGHLPNRLSREWVTGSVCMQMFLSAKIFQVDANVSFLVVICCRLCLDEGRERYSALVKLA